MTTVPRTDAALKIPATTRYVFRHYAQRPNASRTTLVPLHNLTLPTWRASGPWPRPVEYSPLFYRPRQSTTPYKHALEGRNCPLDLNQSCKSCGCYHDAFHFVDTPFVLPYALATLKNCTHILDHGPNVLFYSISISFSKINALHYKKLICAVIAIVTP